MTEILAPVGSEAMLEAAVRSGADAVYLGAGNFNARRGAENFDEDALRRAIAYCRVRGVKVYLTLNTILRDDELPAALNCAKEAADAGADAFIVADLGLAQLLRTALPGLPLHASTQMTVHSPAALPLLKAMGFRRVVLSREMDKEGIRAFCAAAKAVGMQTEVFVHGALCMCMSGQCYLSSLLGRRSGNRGLCAQPCRLPFSVPGGTGHDLSLKDLSLIDHLSELAGMGVDSFKIEGRMKRPEYVAAAVAAAKGKLQGNNTCELQHRLRQVFARSGFTDGYYSATLGRGMFGVRTKEDVQNTADVCRELHELYRTERQSIPLTASISVSPSAVELGLCDGKHTATVKGEGAQAAKSKPLDAESLRHAISKLGGTPYFLTDMKTEIGEGLAVSASALNNLRRSAVEKLTELRSAAPMQHYHAPSFLPIEKREKSPRLLLQFSKIEAIPDDLPPAYAVILPVETDFSKVQLSLPVWAHLPRGIMNNESQMERYLQQAKRCGVQTVLCGTLSSMQLCLQNGLTPFVDFSFNICNRHALQTLQQLGAKGAVLSFENTLAAAAGLTGSIPTALLTYGHLPLMLTRNCPGRNGAGCKGCGGVTKLTDRKGETFFISCRNGFSEILNGIPLYMGDRQMELSICDYHLLRFTVESKTQADEILRCYTAAKPFSSRYTRALYYREVL